MKGLALFVLGVLLGAVLTVVTVGRQLDSAYLERKALQNKVLEQLDTIQRLEKSLADQESQALRVEQVKVSLINPPAPFLALDLEDEALRLLSDLIGKEVGRIDLRLVHNLVHERIVQVEDKRFELLVRGIQLYRQVEVMLEARPLPAEGGEPLTHSLRFCTEAMARETMFPSESTVISTLAAWRPISMREAVTSNSCSKGTGCRNKILMDSAAKS